MCNACFCRVYFFTTVWACPTVVFYAKAGHWHKSEGDCEARGSQRDGGKKKTAVDRYKSAAVLFLFGLFIAQGIKIYTFKVTDSSNK